MNEVADATRNLIEALKTERDELRVQIHLASAEVRDRLEEELTALDHRWAELKSRARKLEEDYEVVSEAVQDDLEDITDNVAESSKAIAKEIREGFERIRNSLKS